MSEEMVSIRPQVEAEVRRATKKEVRKLNDLIVKLEGKLALMTPNDLKKLLAQKLTIIDNNIETLLKSINDIHTLLE